MALTRARFAQQSACTASTLLGFLGDDHHDRPGCKASRGHGMSAEQHDVMTAAEVADYLQIPVRSVHEYAARGELPSVRIGRHRRFSRAAVEAVLERR